VARSGINKREMSTIKFFPMSGGLSVM